MTAGVTNIGTVYAAPLFICDGTDGDGWDEYSLACRDVRELHDVCAGKGVDGDACICPCHTEEA